MRARRGCAWSSPIERPSTTTLSSSSARAASCGPAPNALQVVLGPIADQVAGDIRAASAEAPARRSRSPRSGYASELLAALRRPNEGPYTSMSRRWRARLGSKCVDDAAVTGVRTSRA